MDENKKIKQKKYSIRSRVFSIVQYEKHPLTNKRLISENFISKVFEKRKSIKEYAYICHDRDIYCSDDIEKAKQQNKIILHKVGDKKGKHFHIIFRSDNAISVSSVASWFNVPENLVNVPKGRNAFLDCLAYLDHAEESQQKLGKILYSRSEIISNFDVNAVLENYKENKLLFSYDKRILLKIKSDLFDGKITLRGVRAKYKNYYIKHMQEFYKLRCDALANLPVPKLRINFYIDGASGSGKTQFSKYLARSICGNDFTSPDEDVFFQVGSEQVSFDGYDGQNVIIFDDTRGDNLLKRFRGHGNLYNILDVHPIAKSQNKKFGNIRLLNSVNIINSVQPWHEFMADISEMSDKLQVQSRRRIPFIIRLNADNYAYLVNNSFYFNNKDYTNYMPSPIVEGSVVTILRNKPIKEHNHFIQQLLQPLISSYNETLARYNNVNINVIKNLNINFNNFGKTLPTNFDVLDEHGFPTLADNEDGF